MGLKLVDEHGALLTAVTAQVALTVAVDVEPAHPALDRIGTPPQARVTRRIGSLPARTTGLRLGSVYVMAAWNKET
ncbi:MAG: hypothetical protein ACRDRO_09690 [Pseudonocardiaceae bacterium]